jgi:hypothetical protein
VEIFPASALAGIDVAAVLLIHALETLRDD